jgi:hypothetical protein
MLGVSKMGAAKREAEAFEEMKVDLAQIAIATGAVHLDEEDGETLLTQCNANAERHAYARLTNLCLPTPCWSKPALVYFVRKT